MYFFKKNSRERYIVYGVCTIVLPTRSLLSLPPLACTLDAGTASEERGRETEERRAEQSGQKKKTRRYCGFFFVFAYAFTHILRTALVPLCFKDRSEKLARLRGTQEFKMHGQLLRNFAHFVRHVARFSSTRRTGHAERERWTRAQVT